MSPTELRTSLRKIFDKAAAFPIYQAGYDPDDHIAKIGKTAYRPDNEIE
jgi:hypothetical protein